MKNALILTIVLLMLPIVQAAQSSESYDIASYNPPAGWTKDVRPGLVIYKTSDDKKGTYAIVTLYQSGESSNDPKRDFEDDWRDLVAEPFVIKAKPETQPAAKAEGWTIVSGGSQFANELGTSAVILTTFSGHGKKFSSAAIFNSTDHVSSVEAFLASIKLRKPEPVAPVATAPTNANSLITGTWVASASAPQNLDDYKTPYSANSYGYSKAQYTFHTDGTYEFLSKIFRMTFDKILLVKERGTYHTDGAQLTIAPRSSVIQAWSKRDGTDKWGRLLTTQNRTLEKVTYQFTKHYFSGIQIWNLVLQAEAPTQRDGPFSSNTTFRNAWYYAPVSPNNTAVDLPN
jgi:hypothetical protein